MKNTKNYALISTIKLFLVIIFFSAIGAMMGYYYCKMQCIDRAKSVGFPKQYNYTIEDIETIIFNEPQA